MNVGIQHPLTGRRADVRPEVEPGDQRVSLPDPFDEGADQGLAVNERLNKLSF